MEEIMRVKEGIEEREMKEHKEKEEAEFMVQKMQTNVQNLYKQVAEVPLVIEATMEEQFLKIGEVVKIFREKI
jgi:hypothetical protein